MPSTKVEKCPLGFHSRFSLEMEENKFSPMHISVINQGGDILRLFNIWKSCQTQRQTKTSNLKALIICWKWPLYFRIIVRHAHMHYLNVITNNLMKNIILVKRSKMASQPFNFIKKTAENKLEKQQIILHKNLKLQYRDEFLHRCAFNSIEDQFNSTALSFRIEQ